MSTLALTDPGAPSPTTSLWQKLLYIFVSPDEVFEEVVATPPRLLNWLVPTMLVCLTGLILLAIRPAGEPTTDAIGQFVEAGTAAAEPADNLPARWLAISMLVTCFGTFAGTFWSAFVLWFIGRVFLKTHFAFLKAVEIVGLAGMILMLGTVLTGLLMAATGNDAARPALSLLAIKTGASHRLFAALDVLNFFHLWTALVLAVGLARLGGVAFKEAAYWIIGYWILFRLALALLA